MPGDSGNRTQARERRAVTNDACSRLSIGARRGYLLAFRDAARWDVGDESGVRIAASHQLRIFRDFDNPRTDRFHFAARPNVPAAPLIHVSFRHGVGFDDSDPMTRLLAGKVGSRFLHFLFRHAFGDLAHALAWVCPQALPKIVE